MFYKKREFKYIVFKPQWFEKKEVLTLNCTDKKILHFYRRNKWKGFRLTKMIRLKYMFVRDFFFWTCLIYFFNVVKIKKKRMKKEAERRRRLRLRRQKQRVYRNFWRFLKSLHLRLRLYEFRDKGKKLIYFKYKLRLFWEFFLFKYKSWSRYSKARWYRMVVFNKTFRKKQKGKKLFLFDFKRVYKKYRRRRKLEKVEEVYARNIKFFTFINSDRRVFSQYPVYFLKKVLTLAFVLQAANFMNNTYYLRHMIKNDGALVNKYPVTTPHYLLKRWDFVSILPHYRYLIYRNLRRNVKRVRKVKFGNKYQMLFIKKMIKLFKRKYSSFIELRKEKKKWFSHKFNKRLHFYYFHKSRKIFINVPKCLEVNYRLLMILVLFTPEIRDINLSMYLFDFWKHGMHQRRRNLK